MSSILHKQQEQEDIINFKRTPDRSVVKLDFTEKSNGRGKIHLFYASKFVTTIDADLTMLMKV